MPSRRGATAAVAAALVPIIGLTIGFPVAVEPSPDPVPFLCIVCGSRGSADFLLNVALFAPLGIALRFAGLRGSTAVLLAFGLSAAVETAQLWLPGRYTTLGDLVANTLGGLAGAGIAGHFRALTRPGIGRQTAATAVVAAAWIGTAIAFLPSLPDTAYYGQWTPELGQYAQYRGRVLDAHVDALPAPSWRLEPEGATREALLAGDTVAVTAVAGPPPAAPAPIFSIYDDEQQEIFFLGAHGADLVAKIRCRADDLRLGSPEIRWRAALARTAAGDTLRLAWWRHGPAGACLRQGSDDRRCLVPGPARGWMLILDAGWVPPALWPVADVAWIGGGVALAVAWAPSALAGAAGLAGLAALGVITTLVL